MDLREIVKAGLEANGYDCLCGEGCGCDIDDLMPCGEPFDTSVARWWIGESDGTWTGWCKWCTEKQFEEANKDE